MSQYEVEISADVNSLGSDSDLIKGNRDSNADDIKSLRYTLHIITVTLGTFIVIIIILIIILFSLIKYRYSYGSNTSEIYTSSFSVSDAIILNDNSNQPVSTFSILQLSKERSMQYLP
jgi:hypothetical protein